MCTKPAYTNKRQLPPRRWSTIATVAAVFCCSAALLSAVSRESKVLHKRVDEALKDYDFSGRLQLLGKESSRFIPNTVNELSVFVKKCSQEGTRVRVVGGANSYSPIIQSAERGFLVSLFNLDRLLAVIVEKKQVTVQAGIRERDLHDIVSEYGWSLPQVTRKFNVLAGGLSSGHHSSGYEIPEVASAIVVGMKIMNGVGDIVTARPGEDVFNAALVGLGRVGIITEYTLQCVDKFYLKAIGVQGKTEDLLETMVEAAPTKKFWRLIFFPYTGVGYDLSMQSDFEEGEFVFEESQTKWKGKFDFFYDYTSHWLSFHGYLTRMFNDFVKPLNKLHVLLVGKKMEMTGRRSDWTLAAGTGESEPPHDSYEIAFPLNKCEAAAKMIMQMLEEKGVPFPWCEIRISGPSPAWLSPAYGKHVCWFELPTYHQSDDTHQYVLQVMQSVAEKYDGRPHWGKLNVFATPAPFLAAQYPKFADFNKVVKAMDPLGTFSTPWFDRIFNYSPQLSPDTDTTTSITPLMDDIFSPFHHSTLLIFARLGLFDYIKSQASVTIQDISLRENWTGRATSAMLVSLASTGMLHAQLSGQACDAGGDDHVAYSLSPLGERFLSTENPGHVNQFLELFWEVSPKVLLEKATSVKKQNYMLETGGGGAPDAFFISAMQGQTSFAAQVLAPLVDFESVSQMIDVGGGSGTLVIEACREHSHLNGSVYDLKGVCPLADAYINAANMSDRVATVAGNMFEDEIFPAADCYAFGNVLHDWPEATNYELLVKAYRSLPSNGTVVILEMLIAEDIVSTTRAAAGLNLVMVTNEQGRQYRASELRSMMESVGFGNVIVHSSHLTPYSAVVAKKTI